MASEGSRRKLFRLPLRRRAAVDVTEEFGFHLEMRTSELIARGWDPVAARAEAQRQFGDLDEAYTYCRDSDQRREQRTVRIEWLMELGQDFRFAVRTLRRTPAFTIVAALTLALGIGGNTAIFSVVRGILLRPLPFGDPDRLVVVAASYNGGRPVPYASLPNVLDWRERNRSFSGLGAYAGHSAVLTGAGEPEQLRGFDVTADFFHVLGVGAVRGRTTFSADEAAWNGTKAVLVNESLWRTHFGSNPALVGSMITLDNERYTVAGIVPADSAWPAKAMLWFPLIFDPVQLPNSRGAAYIGTVARLKQGATLEAASSDMRAVAKRLETEFPAMNTGLGTAVIPMQQWITGDLRMPLLLLLGGVGFVLLIACANVANLTLVRGNAREGEFAVRTSLGAGRSRLVRQLVTESLILSLFGAGGGLALAIVGTKLLVAEAPKSIPRLTSIHVDAAVLSVTLVIAVLTGVIFGLIPARQAVHTDIARTLREKGRGTSGRAGARRVLVIAEVALSVMLLAGAGLLIRSFDRLMHVDKGFRTDNTMSFGLSLPQTKYDTPEQKASFMADLMERLGAIPGVQSAGAALGLPLTGFRFSFTFAVQGRPPLDPADAPSAQVRVATPGFFRTMGISTIAGRTFTDADRAGGAKVLVVTERAAKEFFPGENPIGKHVKFGWPSAAGPLEGDIVGVVADVERVSLSAATLPQFYAPFAQRPVQSFAVVLHGSRDPQALIADARRVIAQVDPGLAVTQAKTLDEVLAESVAQPRFYMGLLTAFAIVASLLSAVGIYGVIAYLVSLRSRELAIRIALGASRTAVMRMVVGEGASTIGIGLAVGLAGALMLTQLMGAMLFGVKATDPITYIAAGVALGLIALAATSVPALRASRLDPCVAMRAE